MITWVVADAAALMAGAVLVGLALGGGRRVALAVATLALFGPAYHTIFDGQVNGLAFLGLAVAFWGLARGRDGVAGAGVAAAAALKLTPLALLAYFAWRRRWRAVAVAVRRACAAHRGGAAAHRRRGLRPVRGARLHAHRPAARQPVRWPIRPPRARWRGCCCPRRARWSP